MVSQLLPIQSNLRHRGAWAVASGVVSAVLFAVSAPAQAQEQFSNASIQFDVDTVVEFEFVQSRAVYQSTFGVVNLETGQRTPLIREASVAAQAAAIAEYEFQANTRYGFYLESFYNGQPAGVFYSADAENANGDRRLQFEGDVTQLGGGGVLLRWDDTGSLLVPPPLQDQDFDDFVVRAGGHLACPYSDETAIAPAAPRLHRC